MAVRRRTLRKQCRFPNKKQYTKKQAWDAYYNMIRKQRFGLYVYRCPAKGHYHLGSRKRK